MSGGFGECPVYDAVIHATGLVEYTGRMYVPRVGDYRGRALVIMGREDPFGLGWLERCVQLLEGARVEQLVVAGSGHLSSLERPDVVIPAIDTWLHRGA